jgi:hypothetical protein
VGGELRQLEEGRPRVEQRADALARQQLAARQVPLARCLASAQADLVDARAQVCHLRLERIAVAPELLRARVESGAQNRHRESPGTVASPAGKRHA